MFLLFLAYSFSISFSQKPEGCENGKVYICHKGKNTLCVSESAVPAHLAHGDYLGPCTSGDCNVNSTGGEITCANLDVNLSAISSVSEVHYSWTGPNGFTSDLASPAVNIPGEYTVTITDTVTGCTSTASTTVTSDTTAPDVTAQANGQLTCSNHAVTISGTSSTPGINYKWSGPDGFLSNNQSPVTTSPGEYFLTATNPVNGCSTVKNIIIDFDTITPANILVQVSGNLTCTAIEVTLTATTTTADASFSWSGPGGFREENSSIQVQNPGNYSVIITDEANGCCLRKTVEVQQNITAPPDVNASVSGIITCKDTSVILTGNSSASAVFFSWIGPNGFTSTLQNPVVHNPGIYHLNVTSNMNGCSTKDSVFVSQDTICPGNLIVNNPDTINCSNPVVMLNGSSSEMNVQYHWQGPEGFMISNPQTYTKIAGHYTFTAINPLNGCSDTLTVTVEVDSLDNGCDSSLVTIIMPFYNNGYSIHKLSTAPTKNPVKAKTAEYFTCIDDADNRKYINNIKIL